MLALGVVLLAVAVRGWRSAAPEWSRGPDRLRRAFLGVLDTQMLLGIALYVWLSPFPRTAWSDMGEAMASPVLRFYSIEHLVGMAVAITVAHWGSARAMRREGAGRYRRLATTQIVWLLLTLVSIPWPGLAYGRPLFRVF